MGKAKRRMFFDQVSEVASFTDREEALSLFFQKLEELVLSIRERGDENKLVFYHGLAGIGKTTLLNRLKYILGHKDFPTEGPMQNEAQYREILCAPEMAHCKTISCNFEEKGTKIEMLLHLMEELTKELGFAFPLTGADLYRLGMDASVVIIHRCQQ